MPRPPPRMAGTSLTAGRVRQKLRTRRELLTSAAALLASGRRPTVAEAADAADISRRTAYRYFPTQAKLLTEAALDGLRPVMDGVLASLPAGLGTGDAEARIDALVSSMQQLALENESLLRTVIHETILEPASSARPRRGTRRVEWIQAALSPLRARLGEAAHARLVSAVALCVGAEALIALRDTRGLSAAASVEVSRWAARALVRQALFERGTPGRGGRTGRPARGAQRLGGGVARPAR